MVELLEVPTAVVDAVVLVVLAAGKAEYAVVLAVRL